MMERWASRIPSFLMVPDDPDCRAGPESGRAVNGSRTFKFYQMCAAQPPSFSAGDSTVTQNSPRVPDSLFMIILPGTGWPG